MIASKKIFERLINRVFSNPVSFFDTTPHGRILNRIGKDIDSIDNDLPYFLLEWRIVHLRYEFFSIFHFEWKIIKRGMKNLIFKNRTLKIILSVDSLIV